MKIIINIFVYINYLFEYLFSQLKTQKMESIKDLRTEKKLTQEKLAQLTGLTTVTINRAEKTGKMRLSTYLKIIEILKNHDL